LKTPFYNIALDNQKLKKKFIKGNKRAFDTIYSDYSSAMYSVCLRYTKNTDEAADILQNAFIKIYENRKSFNPQFELGSWIKRIVINTAINHYNKNKKMVLVQDESYFETEVESTVEVESSNDLKNTLMNTINLLPDGYRTIFNLYVFENLTHQEIATHLNISVNTSKSQLSRARKMLKTTLENQNIIKQTKSNAERA